MIKLITILMVLISTIAYSLDTVLVRSQYKRLPNSSEINLFLKNIAKHNHWARYEVIGKSAGGLDFSMMKLSKDFFF